MYKGIIPFILIMSFFGTPAISYAAKLPSSEFAFSTAKVGQKVGGMKITKLEEVDGDIGRAYFSGTLTLTGNYEFMTEAEMGSPLSIASLDKKSISLFPHPKGQEIISISFKNNTTAQKKFKRGTKGKTTFVINQLIVDTVSGEAGGNIATLVKVSKISGVKKF